MTPLCSLLTSGNSIFRVPQTNWHINPATSAIISSDMSLCATQTKGS